MHISRYVTLQTFLVRVCAADLDLAGYAKKALAFLAEVDAEVAAVRTLSDFPAVLKESTVA